MDTLPDELVLEVFRRLSSKDIVRCSLVNSRWYRLAQDNSLWKVANFDSTEIPLRILSRFLNRGIRSLSCRYATIQDPSGWRKLFSPNKLHTLDLSSVTISSRSLGQLLKFTSGLVCLRLRGCQINHIAYKAIASNRNLQELDLSECEKLSGAAYKLIFRSCVMLEDVNFSAIDHLYTKVNLIRSTTMRRLAVRDCRLEYLDLTKKLPDDVMFVLFKRIPVLELPRCAMVCRRWRRLASDQCLWTKVDLSNQTLSFRTLAKVLERGVRELNLEKTTIENQRTSDNILKPDFKSPLRVLNLSRSRTDLCATTVLKHTSELVELRLRHCFPIHVVFTYITQNPNLEILDLSYACKIDNSWISSALHHCKKLKELNMEGAMLGRRALHGLITNLHSNIVRLNLSYVSDHFRDKHVAKVVKKCPNLTHLDVSVNSRLTKKAIDMISKLKHLEELNNEQDEEEMPENDDSSGSLGWDESDAETQYYMYKAFVKGDSDSEIALHMLENLNRLSSDEDGDGGESQYFF